MILENKVAIITGAKQGIGEGIAKKLAAEGCSLLLADIDEEGCKKVADEVSVGGIKAIAVKCDISKKEDTEMLAAKAKEVFGKVDILVNNAGIYPFKQFAEMTEDDWDKVLNINLRGDFLVIKSVLNLISEGGSIINISSIASIIGFAGLSHYCASKSGINGLTRALSLELAAKNIRVNAIAPGAIETPGAAADEKIMQQTIAAIPMKRMGTPDDIAGAVVYLGSGLSNYVTGQVIIVDGGWTVP